MSDNWQYLDWSYVCEQAPLIEKAHERASFQAEYGVNFHEFINTEEGLYPMAQAWWDSLTLERKKELLWKRASELQGTIANIFATEELNDVSEENGEKEEGT